MNCDLTALCKALSAGHEVEPGDGGLHWLRFSDAILKYELTIDLEHNSVQLAADLEKPIQACPLLEYTFLCTEIEVGSSAYGSGPAVRFYEHRESQYGMRLTMIGRPDNRWYLWANGMPRPAMQEDE